MTTLNEEVRSSKTRRMSEIRVIDMTLSTSLRKRPWEAVGHCPSYCQPPDGDTEYTANEHKEPPLGPLLIRTEEHPIDLESGASEGSIAEGQYEQSLIATAAVE